MINLLINKQIGLTAAPTTHHASRIGWMDRCVRAWLVGWIGGRGGARMEEGYVCGGGELSERITAYIYMYNGVHPGS